MIIEEIQGNIANLSQDEKQKHVEKVYLENSDLVKRIQRVKTDHGNEIGIRLKQPIDLQYGDILYQDDTNMIIVDVEDLLKELGIPYSHEDRKVNQAFRHIGHSHD